MTLKTYDIEVAPAGTVLTAGNTGANQVTPNTGSAVSGTTGVRTGSFSAKMTTGATALSIIRFNANAPSLTMSWGGYFTVEATPASVTTAFATLRSSSATTIRLNWTTTNSVTITDSAGSSVITLATGLTPGQPYWYTIRCVVGTSTTGTFTVNVYNSALTLVGTASSSTYNLGTAAVTAGDNGIVNTTATTGTVVDFDYIVFNDGSTAEIMPPASNYTGSVALTGTGALSASGKPAIAGSVSLTGAGTLTTSGTPATNATANLTGAATLSATGTPTFTAGVGLTSNGTLTVISNPAIAAQVTLSSAGTLTITGRPTFAARADLTSDAQLLADGAPNIVATVNLSGTATLTAKQQTPQRDITVTATLEARRWSGQITGRTKQGMINARRWGGSI